MSKNKGFEIFLTDPIKELGKTVLPEPDLLDYYNKTANREIYWNEIIDDALVDCSLLVVQWNKEDKDIEPSERKPIKIFINSDGGDLIAVMNFISTIKLSKTPVVTIGLGKCFSSGGLLLMAGHKRLIFPNTTVLIHDGSTGAIGDTGKVMDSFEFTQKQEKKVKEYILANTKISDKLYTKNYRKDWFLMPEEVISLGIADRIIEDLEEVF